MNQRRRFLQTIAAGPASALLLPLFAETGPGTLAADVECVAEKHGRLPENIVYSKSHQGVWKGKAGSHVPLLEAKRDGDKVTLTVRTKHRMTEPHYIVRHTVVAACGKVVGGKTFRWTDQPVSTYEVTLPAGGKPQTVFVTSYCSKHDLWVAQTKLEV